MEIILENVSILDLQEKIKAFETLFSIGPGRAEVSVSGTFQDCRGDIAFLSKRFYLLDTGIAYGYRRRYLPVIVEGELWRLTPLDNRISQVKLSHCERLGG